MDKTGNDALNDGMQAKADAALIDAAISGDPAKVRSCLAAGASATAVDSGGFTALMWAARYDLPQAAQELLPASELNQRDPSGRTAAMIGRDGAGTGSRAAKLIEAYALALSELASISQSANLSLKKINKKFRL
jgi:hypothetical protein